MYLTNETFHEMFHELLHTFLPTLFQVIYIESYNTKSSSRLADIGQRYQLIETAYKIG